MTQFFCNNPIIASTSNRAIRSTKNLLNLRNLRIKRCIKSKT